MAPTSERILIDDPWQPMQSAPSNTPVDLCAVSSGDTTVLVGMTFTDGHGWEDENGTSLRALGYLAIDLTGWRSRPAPSEVDIRRDERQRVARYLKASKGSGCGVNSLESHLDYAGDLVAAMPDRD